MEVTSHLTEKAKRDYALVRRAREQGDRKAYAELLHNYRDSLYFLLLRMTRNPTDAEDLTIEAFGKAFHKLEQYTTDYAFSTWLFKIAANNCIDFMRRSRRIEFSDPASGEDAEQDDYSSAMASDTLDPEERVIEKQKIRLMREVVEKLKPHYRRLIELRYFQEWSYEEIGDELDLPIGTVKSQLYRSRAFLYEILKHAEEKI